MSSLSFHDKQHVLRLLQQQGQIKRIFDDFARRSGLILTEWSEKNINNVWLRNSKYERQIDKLLEELHDNLLANITNNTAGAWEASNLKNDDLLKSFIKDMALPELIGKSRYETLEKGMFSRNMEAFNAFQRRKINGLTLSDTVWKSVEGAKENLEYYLSSGISTGRPAALISQDIRQLLQNPDRRFRRIKDEEGKLVLSKPMQDYHPGQGQYRSSFKNALRVAATETNQAYHLADHERWKKQGFVLGIEVHRSKSNKGPCPVCDPMVGKYPPDYKFLGNHPWCICFAVPIMLEGDELIDYLLTGEVPQEKIIKTVPKSAKDWVNEKASRNKELFVKENKKYYHTAQDESLKRKIAKAEKPHEKNIYVAFEPFSPVIVKKLSELRTNKERQLLLHEIMKDDGFDTLFEVDKNKTIIHPHHKGNKSKVWEETKQMARAINKSGFDVAFLPEYKDISSADAITSIAGKLQIADFKYSSTTNSNTLSVDLIKGFSQANSIVLKLEKMDRGQFVETMEYIKRNTNHYGNIKLINRYGEIVDLERNDFRLNKYKKKIKGFL